MVNNGVFLYHTQYSCLCTDPPQIKMRLFIVTSCCRGTQILGHFVNDDTLNIGNVQRKNEMNFFVPLLSFLLCLLHVSTQQSDYLEHNANDESLVVEEILKPIKCEQKAAFGDKLIVHYVGELSMWNPLNCYDYCVFIS